VEAYFPLVGQQLHTEVVIPPHAEVANAIGAVVGGVVQQMRVEIHPLDDESGFRVHLPDGVHDLGTLEGAVQYARGAVSLHLENQARKAGAEQVEVSMARHDSSAPVRAGWGQELFLGTELVFTAMGRPSLARGQVPEPGQRSD
jgi:hypothetical protein